MLDISRPMYISATSVLPDEPIGGILTIDMNNTFGDNQVVKHASSTNNTWTTTTQVRALSAHFNAGWHMNTFVLTMAAIPLTAREEQSYPS